MKSTPRRTEPKNATWRSRDRISQEKLRALFLKLVFKRRHKKHILFTTESKNIKCLFDIFCTFWISKRRLRNIVCLLRVKTQKRLFDVFCKLWISKRRLRNILCLLRVKTQDIFLTSFVRYECLKDVSETSCVY